MECGYEEYVLKHFDPAKRNYEEVIAGLRKAGALQMDTVKALKFALKMNLGEADRLVLFSETWKDQLELTLKIRQEVERAAEELASESKKPKNS